MIKRNDKVTYPETLNIAQFCSKAVMLFYYKSEKVLVVKKRCRMPSFEMYHELFFLSNFLHIILRRSNSSYENREVAI